MTDKPSHLPERLALLADLNAARYITEGLRTGKEDVPAIALNKVTEPLPAEEARGALQPVRDLVDDAMHVFGGERVTAADAWLAPRLHATLRLTRREAADNRLWNYLALGVAPDYVVCRHKSDKGEESKVAAKRFRGSLDSQAFARLWWAAELFRNGSDYGPVVTACGQQEMFNSALRLSVIDHRPTALALVDLMVRGTVRTGREVNALVKAVNASAATIMYDVIAPDIERDGRPLAQWIEEAEWAPAVPRKVLPEGPDEERAPEESVAALAEHFAELFAEAPVRGKKSEGDEAE
ncbi:hypothetical protein EAO73_03565 [Streptomyces sp. col6]|uniref:DUF6339 family protein n=1 Tax=Streptomyces sp. col6 TaxID=2478958 RepID=UPI0011CE39C6|nr:DUF6339 family protein [Streptomyces sp. col6]TXS06917.1 hypothetical protein EAO73_03565 [Streptomyces sp. col6]